MSLLEDIKTWIQNGLPGSQVVAIEGDGRHFKAVVICHAFESCSMLVRHRMVYEALGTHMRHDIHALSLKTFTPQEYQVR